VRKLFVLIILILSGVARNGFAQTGPTEGAVTYLSSQNIYVRYSATTGMAAGDTLFIIRKGNRIPAMVVVSLSSISCVCTPLPGMTFKVADKIYFQSKTKKETLPAPTAPPVAVTSPEPSATPAVTPKEPGQDTVSPPTPKNKRIGPPVSGYVGIAAYYNTSNTGVSDMLRMKYTLSFNARRIAGTGLSTECYINFIHSNYNWDEVSKNLFTGLKIYSLDVSYAFGKHYSVWLGRRINPNISNMGAVDGLQFEMKFKPFTIGIIAGSRPDYRDYGFNFNLLQFGAFVSHEQPTKHGYFQTTLAFVQQNNSGNVDRRFAYLQHVNSILPKLTFFGSAEVDLYKMVLNSADSSWSPSSTPRLSDLYLSLNYRIIKELSVAFSYSARQNVVYYETYKNYLDQLLDYATLQGYLLTVNARPVRNLSLGVTGGYRFEKADVRPTKNVYGYLTYAMIPALNISSTLSYTWLQSAYANGSIYSLGVTKDLAKGKLFTGLTYRYAAYHFTSTETTPPQNLAEASLVWRFYKKMLFSVYYEGTFQKADRYSRIYGQLNIGF
jgi:hypothetical protein